MPYQYETRSADDADVVVELPYAPATSGLPVEAFRLSSLLVRRSRSELTDLQRLRFDLLVSCIDGSGRHEVDFESVDVFPGRVLHVRPGQVHRWVLDVPYEAHLILLRPLDQHGGWRPGPHVIDTDPQLERDLEHVLELVSSNGRSTALSIPSLEAVRDLLVAMLGLDRPRRQEATQRELIYDDFERLLGDAEQHPRTVQDCARLLGCSTRTLTRACQAAAGVAPKELLDRAVALEAQRQLTAAGFSATRVAEALGFAELSHFTRFFGRVTGETPSAFVASFATGGERQQSLP